MTEKWLDKKRLADHYSCSVRSIEIALKEGMPHAVIFGRVKFQVSSVEPFLEERGHLRRQTSTCTVTATQAGQRRANVLAHDREVSPDG